MDEPDDLPIIELETDDAPRPRREPTELRRRRAVAIAVAVVVAAGLVVAVARRGHHGRDRTADTIVLPGPARPTTPPPIGTLDPEAEFVSASGVVAPHGAWAINTLELALTDDGVGWRNITPPGFGSPVDQTSAIAILDAQHAWIATDVPVPTIWRATDGGRSWQATRVNVCGDACGSVVSIDFLDARRGWIVVVNGGAGALAVTDDGGATWRRVGPTPVLGPVHFVDARHAWMTSSDQAGAIFRTGDAGTSWSFVVPADSHSATITAPVFFGPTTVLLATVEGNESQRVVIWRSTDAGDSWTESPLPLPADAVVHDPPDDRFTATSPSDWMLLDGTHLSITNDAGAHWRTRTPTRTLLRAVAFTTATEGWLLADIPGCGGQLTGCHDQYLYRTVDGGRTWTLRSPTAGITADRSP